MDTMKLAHDALEAALPYLQQLAGSAGGGIGQAIGERAASLGRALWEGIERRVAGDTRIQDALRRLQEKPDSTPRKQTANGVLAELLESDATFADQLAKLLDRVQGDTISQHVEVSGSSVVGQVSQVGKVIHRQ